MSGEEPTLSLAEDAHNIFKIIICKWLHTEWVHDIRESRLKEDNYDLFDGIRFDIETETEKLYNQVRAKQIDIATFHRQRSRLLKLTKG